MGRRFCHADADTDADSNGIRAETNMSPLPLVGDIINSYTKNFCKELKNEFEIAVLNESSVFEPLKFYS